MSKKPKNIWFWLSVAFLVVVILALMVMEDNIEVAEKPETNTRIKVSYVDTKVQAHEGSIRTLSEVKPRWSATLKSHIDGEVIEVSANAMDGEQVDKGDLLVRIEDSAYLANLEEAKRQLAKAELALTNEKAKTDQALKDWERSGLTVKPSAIALNEPQLELAKQTVTSAKANVVAAEKQRIYTVIKAPFSGVITSRLVSIGQTVNIGDPLVSLLNQSDLDLSISLSAKQWKNLSKDWTQQTAKVKDADGKLLALANIKRGGGFLDPESRQYRLFLEVDNSQANNHVLAGEFVHVELPSESQDHSILIPASAYTQEGTVWYIDDDDRLNAFDSTIAFYQDNKLIATTPEHLWNRSIRVVVSPLASFIAGIQVEPVSEQNKIR